MPADFQKSRLLIDHRPDLGVQRLAGGRAYGPELLLDPALRIPGTAHREDRVDGRVAAQVEHEAGLLLGRGQRRLEPGSTMCRNEMQSQRALDLLEVGG